MVIIYARYTNTFITECFTSQTTLLALLLCYAVVFYSPHNFVHRLLSKHAVWTVFYPIVDVLVSASSIIEAIDMLERRVSDENIRMGLFGLALAGFASAEAGALLSSSMDLRTANWIFSTPASIRTHAPFGLWPSIIGSLLYSCWVTWLRNVPNAVTFIPYSIYTHAGVYSCLIFINFAEWMQSGLSGHGHNRVHETSVTS